MQAQLQYLYSNSVAAPEGCTHLVHEQQRRTCEPDIALKAEEKEQCILILFIDTAVINYQSALLGYVGIIRR